MVKEKQKYHTKAIINHLILKQTEQKCYQVHIYTIPGGPTDKITPSADFSRSSWLRLRMYNVPAVQYNINTPTTI